MTIKELQYTCKKCGYKTNRCNDYYKHINLRKKSCNKEFDNQILNLALEKIITFKTEKEDFEITYTTDTYTLYIKRNCFHNHPYFENFVIRYDEPNLHVGFFAEWVNDNHGNPRNDKIKIVK